MTEPIETVITRAQQNFEVVGELYPIEITIYDDRIINIFKKYKHVVYKIIPFGLLFPATIENGTEEIFVLAKNLKEVKKFILNYKTFDIIGDIDLKKIPNWKEIKGQSVQTNIQFKNHKEINQSSHLCFPFITKSFNDLTSFSIYLQDSSNEKIKFESNEKKGKYFQFSNRNLFIMSG